MIISTFYLPETTVNLRHQHVPSRSISAGHRYCSVMIGTVRYRVLVFARPQVGALHRARHQIMRSPTYRISINHVRQPFDALLATAR